MTENSIDLRPQTFRFFSYFENWQFGEDKKVVNAIYQVSLSTNCASWVQVERTQIGTVTFFLQSGGVFNPVNSADFFQELDYFEEMKKLKIFEHPVVGQHPFVKEWVRKASLKVTASKFGL